MRRAPSAKPARKHGRESSSTVCWESSRSAASARSTSFSVPDSHASHRRHCARPAREAWKSINSPAIPFPGTTSHFHQLAGRWAPGAEAALGRPAPQLATRAKMRAGRDRGDTIAAPPGAEARGRRMTQIGCLALALSRILVAATTPRRSFPLPFLPTAQSPTDSPVAALDCKTAAPSAPRSDRSAPVQITPGLVRVPIYPTNFDYSQDYVSGSRKQGEPVDHRLMPSPGFNLEAPFR